MPLPAALSVPRLDPAEITRIERLCNAIVESRRLGLDAQMLVDSLNDCTANEFSLDEIVAAVGKLGARSLAELAISPPAPRVDASLADWAEILRRLRAGEATPYERMWWLELIERAAARDDATEIAICADGRTPDVVAAELFA